MSTRWVRVAAAVVLAVGAGACVEPGFEACPRNVYCPAGMTCTLDGDCAEVERVDACAGRAEGAACTYGDVTVTDAFCRRGVCQAAGCGNGVVEAELDEACDDGNNASADGCSADCRSDEACGNQRVDAAVGEQCDLGEANGGAECRADCTVPFCGDGIVDASEACDDGDGNSDAPAALGADRPCRTTCRWQACGDGVLDDAERCDDGNQASADGCAFDCQSDETCGNGYTDFATSEQCDASADVALGGDGCGQACTLEVPTWRQVSLGRPPNRSESALAYAPDADQVLLFGGTTGSELLGDTWVFDVATEAWTQLRPRTAPPARAGHALAYDSARGVFVLFGGNDEAARYVDDTWEFELATRTWREVEAPVRPSGRARLGAAFDPTRGQVVLFGGEGTGGKPNDTWVFDGATSTWSALSIATPPAGRIRNELTFHAGRGQVVMSSGRGSTGTWALDRDANAWVSMASNTPQAWDTCLAFDEASQQLVMSAGVDNWTITDRVLALDEATGLWAPLAPGGAGPGLRRAPSCAYVASRQAVLVFGSAATFFGTDALGDDTHWLDLAALAWTRVSPALPPAAPYTSLTYDLHTGQLVLLQTYYGRLEAWLYAPRDERWTRVDTPPELAVRWNAAIEYDPRARKVVLFGGTNGAIRYDETWLLDVPTRTWTQLATPTAPPSRASFDMTYDPQLERIVLFGGWISGVQYFADTWLLDAVAGTWTNAAPATSPSARFGAAMTFDARVGRVVLFGGWLGAQQGGDSWSYDAAGNRWDPLEGPGAPEPRQSPAMAFDHRLGQTILFGGINEAIGPPGSTWLLDASRGAWTEIYPARRPPTRWAPSAAIDPLSGDALFFGGFNAECSSATSADCGDVWAFRFADPARAEDRDRCDDATWDSDGDGAFGCEDPDCWAACDPHCPPRLDDTWAPPTPACADPGRERCGDGTCNTLETAALCPADCAE